MVVVKKVERDGKTYYVFNVIKNGKEQKIVTTDKKWAERAARSSKVVIDEKGFIRHYGERKKEKPVIIDVSRHGKKYQSAVSSLLEKASKKYDEYVEQLKKQGKIVFTESEWAKLANQSAFARRIGKDVVIVKDKEDYLREVNEKGIKIEPVKKTVTKTKDVQTPPQEKTVYVAYQTEEGMKTQTIGKLAMSVDEIKKELEKQGIKAEVTEDKFGNIRITPIIQRYEVSTPEGKYQIIKNIKTGETKYKIGKFTLTEEAFKEFRERGIFSTLSHGRELAFSFLTGNKAKIKENIQELKKDIKHLITVGPSAEALAFERATSPEDPLFTREIFTTIGGIISGQQKRAEKEIEEFQKKAAIRSILLSQQKHGPLKRAAEAGLVSGVTAAAALTGGGAFGTLPAIATDVAFAGMGAYTVLQSAPKALATGSPEAIGETLLGVTMIAGPIVARLPVGRKTISLELKPTDVALDLYKRPVRKGEFLRTGRVKIKTKEGVTLDGYLLEKTVETPKGTVKKRFIELKGKTAKINGRKVKIPSQKIGVRDVDVLSHRLYERRAPLEHELILKKEFVSPEIILSADKELLPRIHGTREITRTRVFPTEEGVSHAFRSGEKMIRTREITRTRVFPTEEGVSHAFRSGEKMIRTRKPEKPVTEITKVTFSERAVASEKELLAAGEARILSDTDKAFRTLRYGVRETEAKPSIIEKVLQLRQKIESMKGRIQRGTAKEAKIQRKPVKVEPKKIFEKGDNLLLQKDVVKTEEGMLRAEETLAKLETARRLGEVENGKALGRGRNARSRSGEHG